MINTEMMERLLQDRDNPMSAGGIDEIDRIWQRAAGRPLFSPGVSEKI